MRDHRKKIIHEEVLTEDDDENETFYMGFKKNIRDFLDSSTLHGLKYLADDKITIFERSFFGASFVFVILCSAFFISNIYTKWSASPIIITTSSQPTFTTSIPFPAVTICSLNQALRSRVMEINKSSLNYTLLMSLCDKDNEMNPLIGQLTWKKFKRLLMRVSQPCNAMLAYCRYGSIIESCAKIFNPVLTDDGLCCTFNAVDPSFLLRNYTEDERFSGISEGEYVPIDWTPEMGFGPNIPPKFYPRITAGTGSRMGLTVILNASFSEYYCSTSKSIGFKVLVHNPAEQPKISNFGFLLSSGRESRISVDPQYQTAVPAIRKISSKIRQCLFSDEGDLSFFRTYSRKNCELECEARILSQNCNCILYYLPRIDPDSKICGPKDNHCTKLIQSEIQSSNGNYSCDTCLPACFELSYNPTVTSTTMVDGDFITNDDYPIQLFADMSDVTVVHFYYLTNVFRSTTKGEMFGFTEFLSNTGGLLGLFMGFSVFSIIEILYFIVLRPNCDHRVRKRQKKAAEQGVIFENTHLKQSENKYHFQLEKRNVWTTPVKARKSIRQSDIAKKWVTERKNRWSMQQAFNNRNMWQNDEIFPYID